MRLRPTSKQDWLLILCVAPLVLWLPIGLLLLVGLQGATPRDPAPATVLAFVATVTIALLGLAITGVRRIGLRRR
jgi:hypothetical protein